MNRQILALLAAIAVAVTLSACGGGGGGGSEIGTASPSQPPGGTAPLGPRPESAFASAAMYVPTGAASKSFAVSDCMAADKSAAKTTVTMATVVIQANGDIVFFGAVGSATVAELARINFADTNDRQVYGGKRISGDFGHAVEYFTADDRDMELSSFGGGFRSSSPTLSYNCSTGITTATLVLQQPLGQARVVSNIVAGSTGTVAISPGSSSVPYTQTASIVSWDSRSTTATFARFISFNLDTAQFGQGTLLNPKMHTPIPFSLPALGSAISGFYEESLSSTGDKTVFFEHDNIEVLYRRYANPAANIGIGREFRFYPS
jgi:hypothetical protein